jgi:hypothetical protein
MNELPELIDRTQAISGELLIFRRADLLKDNELDPSLLQLEPRIDERADRVLGPGVFVQRLGLLEKPLSLFQDLCILTGALRNEEFAPNGKNGDEAAPEEEE